MIDPTYYTPGMAMSRRKDRARTPGLWVRPSVRRGSRTGPTGTKRPAIAAHAATGRADIAEHEHTPGPAAGVCRKAGCYSPAQDRYPPRPGRRSRPRPPARRRCRTTPWQ